jgi:hypothetical protein
MAKEALKTVHIKKKGSTTIGCGSIKLSGMNKDKRRSYKKYRGQGKP